MRAIVTVPPHADFLAAVAAHPSTAGLRLNTIMPVAEPEAAVLSRLAALGPPLWVDLKGRQLRVVDAALPPFTTLRLSHAVRCSLPADLFLSDGREHARVIAIARAQGDRLRPADDGFGDQLILDRSPRRLVGPGESVNILAEDLQVEGDLTVGDRRWLAAMAQVGQRRVMLSFVESEADVAGVRALLPDAEVAQKIESRRGLAYARETGGRNGRLVAARGDLFVEVGAPHRILRAMRELIAADPDAIAASRVLSGLAWDPVPTCAELSDLGFLHGLGYRTVMLGDQVCQQEDSVLAALDLLAAASEELACG